MRDNRKAYLVEVGEGRFYRLTDTLGRMMTTERLAEAMLFDKPREACRVSLLFDVKGRQATARAMTV